VDTETPIRALVEQLAETLTLKALDRAGWLRHGIQRVESVAAHSWGVSWLVMQFLPDDLDQGRALAYATLHDVAEIRVGDLTPADGVSSQDKARLESDAMRAICERLPRGDRLLGTWLRYEAQADPEARFVRQLDRLDMALQALVYARQHDTDLVEFVDSAATVVVHPELKAVLDTVRGLLPG
jgi:putative hydrolase of HD superfamily